MELDPNPPRNPDLEALIAELADLLGPAQASLVRPGSAPRLPVLLVVGPPRSGTTLLMQWVAASGAFAYPTNLLARFSAVPAVGARIQRLIADPRFAWAEQLDPPAPPALASALGKTRGTLSPNEFWWFWRRFLPTQALRHLGPDTTRVDVAGLRAELSALEEAFAAPLAFKGMILQHDAAFFSAALPTAVWLWLHRDPVDNARSLLGARERYHGDAAVWYSVEPAATASLVGLDPLAQVVGQVFHTHLDLRHGLAAVDPSRVLRVGYEAFCADPGAVWSELRARLEPRGIALGDPPAAAPRLANPHRGDPAEAARIRSLWADHERVHGRVLP